MKNIKFLLIISCISFGILKSEAEWTFLTIIQADNNLCNYAWLNISDMQLGTLDNPKVNVLIQWDQPNNNKTWRYRIVHGGKIEDASLSSEMGINPSKEIEDCMSWVAENYKAKHYAIVLWNHGMGVEDKSEAKSPDRYQYSWIDLPGYQKCKKRGILYDDSQGTYLATQDIDTTFAQVTKILGKPISVLGMDACMMGGIDVIYEVKDYAEVVVASEQTEPGNGWPYSPILASLTSVPENINAIKLGQIIVAAYDQFYKKIGEPDYTQSVISVVDLAAVKANIDDMYAKVAACKTYKSAAVKNAILAARNKTLSFYISDYIDLYGFYNNLLTQVQALKTQKSTNDSTEAVPEKSQRVHQKPIQKPRPKPRPKPNTTTTSTTSNSNQAYITALAALETSLKAGLTLITSAVKANAAGPSDKGAKGISIYYPASKSPIASTYKNTLFAQQSKWLAFITENR